jgi:hypothetical protein
MDLENEKIGPAYSAPDSYFKETESRLMQRLGIQSNPEPITAVNVPVSAPIDTTGVQKRARKQDPQTAKSEGVNKEVDALGNVVIPPLTFTTNENPEWVNFGAIAEDVSGVGLDDQIKVVSYGDLLDQPVNTSSAAPEIVAEQPVPVIETAAELIPELSEEIQAPQVEIIQHVGDLASPTVTEPDLATTTEVSTESETTEEEVLPVESSPSKFYFINKIDEEPKVVVHEVPESVGLDELESYFTAKNTVPPPTEEKVVPTPRFEETPVAREVEEKPISLEAPATAFAPIAGRQRESATPGWLGVAAALAAIVAAYFIWTAIQPPKLDTEEVVLQQDEATIPEAPLDEQVVTDTIPDGLQLVEPLIMEEMPKYKEPNVYTIIDAEDMPERTKQALQDLEDNGLATFDMEDELFEELDFESL